MEKKSTEKNKTKKKWLAAQIAGADMVFKTFPRVLQLPLQFHPLGNGHCNSLQPQEWIKTVNIKEIAIMCMVQEI